MTATPKSGVKKHGHLGGAIPQILPQSGANFPFRYCFLLSVFSLRLTRTWLFLE